MIFNVDNDAFTLSDPTNGLYTHGAKLTFRFPVILGERLARDEVRAPRRVYGMRLGQEIYTPEDIAIGAAEWNGRDRPYAAWAFAGAFTESYWPAEVGGQSLRAGIDLGCLGPCAHGEETQRTVHDALGTADANGWSAQVRGGVVVNANVEYVPRRFTTATGRIEVSPLVRGALGNMFINAGVGTMVRAGRFDSSFDARAWPTDASPLSAATSARMNEAFLFARLETRAVAHDATLQGGWRSDSPQTVTPAPILFETEWGAAYRRRQWAMSVSFATRSNVIKDAPFTTTRHRWGKIQVAWNFH